MKFRLTNSPDSCILLTLLTCASYLTFVSASGAERYFNHLYLCGKVLQNVLSNFSSCCPIVCYPIVKRSPSHSGFPCSPAPPPILTISHCTYQRIDLISQETMPSTSTQATPTRMDRPFLAAPSLTALDCSQGPISPFSLGSPVDSLSARLEIAAMVSTENTNTEPTNTKPPNFGSTLIAKPTDGHPLSACR